MVLTAFGERRRQCRSENRSRWLRTLQVDPNRPDAQGAGRRLLRRGARGVRRTVARRPRVFVYLAIIGPGVITAAAGNDAGGIATFASVGADYGYQFLWLLIPLTISLGIVRSEERRVGKECRYRGGPDH